MSVAPPPPLSQSTRGRGMIIAGAVLLAVSILGGIVGLSIVGSTLDISDFDRGVTFDGPSERIAPGRLAFSVLEPLDGSDSEMTVGIALSSTAAPEPTCEILDADGASTAYARAQLDEELLDPDGQFYDFDVVGTSRLAAGDYEAVCDFDGEPSTSTGVSFTAGRVIAVEDITGMAGSIFGIIGIIGAAGLLFVLGVILLIVGLVQRSRSNRSGGGQYQPGQYGPSPCPPGPAQQGPYQQGPPQQGPYPQGPPQQGPPALGQYQPGPSQPGPYAPAPWQEPPPWQDPHAPAEPPRDKGDEPPDAGSSGWTIPPSKR